MGRLRARSVMALLLSAALVGIATGDVAGVTAGAEMAVAEPGAEQVTKATSPRQLVSAIASRLERTRSEVAKGVARASPASGGLNAQFESSSQESQQQPAASPHGEPIAVLVCMQGAALSLEFDTLLKSLLANLPRRSAVELFVVGDGAAIDAAREQVARAGETPSRYRTLQRQGEELMSGPLEGALFPVRFELHLIDVSARAPAWEAHLLANISSKIAYRSPMGDAVHSNQVGVWEKGGIGQWYRYFSYEGACARPRQRSCPRPRVDAHSPLVSPDADVRAISVASEGAMGDIFRHRRHVRQQPCPRVEPARPGQCPQSAFPVGCLYVQRRAPHAHRRL